MSKGEVESRLCLCCELAFLGALSACCRVDQMPTCYQGLPRTPGEVCLGSLWVIQEEMSRGPLGEAVCILEGRPEPARRK